MIQQRKTSWNNISDTAQPNNKSIWRRFSRRKALPQKDNSLDRQNKELWKEFQDISAFWEAFEHLRQQAVSKQQDNTNLHEPDIGARSSFTLKTYWKGIATIALASLLLLAGASQFISHKPKQEKTDMSTENTKTWQDYKANQDFMASGASLTLNRTIWSTAKDTSIVIALPKAKTKQVQDSIPAHYISYQYLLQALAQSTQRPCNLKRSNQAVYKLFTPNDTTIYFIEGKGKVLHRVLQLKDKFYKIKKSGRLDSINVAHYQVYKAYFTLEKYWLDKPMGQVQGLRAILYKSNKNRKKFYVTPSQWKDKHFHLQIKAMPLFAMVQ